MRRVFICYRREDARNLTERVCDHLMRVLGEDNVYKDVDSIPLGIDFRRAVQSAIASSDAGHRAGRRK